MKILAPLLLGRTFPCSASIDIGLFIVRAAIGVALCTFFEGSIPREGHWGPQEWLITAIAQMGFPVPTVFAWFAVLTTFFGGMLLVLGLAARPAALLNGMTTFVATFVYYQGSIFGAGLLPAVFFAMTLGLTFTGPGKISIDYGLSRTSEGARIRVTSAHAPMTA